jgi:hypothetical protein
VAGSGDWRQRDGALVTSRGGELHGSVPCELRNLEEEPKGEEMQRRAHQLAHRAWGRSRTAQELRLVGKNEGEGGPGPL